MKAIKLLLLFFCMAMFVQCKKSDTVIVNFEVNDKKQESAVLTIGDKEYLLVLGKEGKASVNIEGIDVPKYGKIKYGSRTREVFLERGKEVNISFLAQSGKAGKLSFKGDNGRINEYLSTRRLKRCNLFKKTDSTLFSSIDNCIEENIKDLETKGLKDAFVKLEKERIKYTALECIRGYYKIHIYPGLYDDYDFSPYFFTKLESYFSDSEELLQLEEYKAFVNEALYARIAGKRDEYDQREITGGILNYIVGNFENPRVVEYLVHTFSLKYVSQFGVDNTENIVSIYNAKVTDIDLQKEFKATYDKWSVLAKGKRSPSFKYQDINGKEFSLESLRGKYIYIDVWATWCGPCCAEIPHVQKLEKEFHGKNICFVSISTDKDKKKWEQKVRKDNMGGIQLNMGRDKAFKKAYSITSIPRFILLDKEGKVISANCTRPSDPKTRATLLALPGL